MALTDESGMVMPVAPMNGVNNNGFGGDFMSWIVLLLIFGMFGNGWGGGFGGGYGVDGLYPWMNQAQLTAQGFDTAALNGSLGNIQNSLTSGFSDVQMALCNGFAGIEAGANARQIANMQTAFAGQTAMNQGFNNVTSQLAQCCCDNRLASADLKYTIATENCADRAALSDGIKDLLSATQAQTQAILNQLCNDKIEQKNDIISQLRSELMYARGQASQDVQTAAIQAGQRTLANEIEQYVAPKPMPAYVVQNPNCCGNYTPCGCGV